MTTRLMRDQVAEMISKALRTAQADGSLPEFQVPEIAVERSRQTGHGDYASPTCLQLARVARMSPRDIASRVVDHLVPADFVGRVEVAGPGYINITLSPEWLAARVPTMLDAGDRWGFADGRTGPRVQVEYVSANPTGPITVASTRNAVIGDVLANVLAAAGYEVEREYYVNDAGSQIRHFGESIYARYLQALGRDEPFPEDGYHGQYVAELGEALSREHGDRYVGTERRQAIQELGGQGTAG